MSITLIIVIITCLVSITAFNRPGDIDKLSFWPYQMHRSNEYYRFLTSGLVHRDFIHLFFNMITLFFMGDAVEQFFTVMLGSKWYYPLMYVLGLVLPDMFNFFKHKNNSHWSSIGASGAVSAVVFSCVLFAPWQTIYVFIIPIWFILYAVLFLIYSIYMSRRGGDGIDHTAHFYGALLGLIFPIVINPQVLPFFLNRLLNP